MVVLASVPAAAGTDCATRPAAPDCALDAPQDPVIGLSRLARALLAASPSSLPAADPEATIAYRRTVRVLATLAATNGMSASAGTTSVSSAEAVSAALHLQPKPETAMVTALLLPPPTALPPRPRARPSPDAVEDGGRLAPVSGRLVERFGARLPDGGVRRGLSYQAQAGELVRAPAAGRIAFAGPFRGYGLLLIVEHADGYHSLLTGLGRIDTHIEDLVRAGDPIGAAAGADGVAPRVYLEVRRGGRPIDPLPWLASAN